MSKHWILYGHGGSGNHGCEAIVRTVLKILQSNDAELLSLNQHEDQKYGIDGIIKIKSAITVKHNIFDPNFISAYLKLKLFHRYEYIDALPYIQAIEKYPNSACALSIGGDNYCYGDTTVYACLNKMYNDRGIKTAMIGCSIEPKVIKNPKVTTDLRKYSFIIARESITYNALLEAGLSNAVLYPDPAFQLDRVDLPLPEGFVEGNTVGINMSHVVEEGGKTNDITIRNYERLIEDIIDKTDMGIALIPHVVWPEKDDRITMQRLFEKYAHSGRVVMIEDHNCMELKGYIARCRFMVAARTHASIAAYSSSVPTLVVGYSVKAKGIAKDLFGTFENYVLPVQSLTGENELSQAFRWIVGNEKGIRDHLDATMPEYCARALKIKDELQRVD